MSTDKGQKPTLSTNQLLTGRTAQPRFLDLSKETLSNESIHRKLFSLNSTAVNRTSICIGPFEIYVNEDKKSIDFYGNGITFFLKKSGEPLNIPFKGEATLVDRAMSLANIQMEAGRAGHNTIHAAFYREDRMPIAIVTATKSRAGIKLELRAPFGHWLRGTDKVELIEGNL